MPTTVSVWDFFFHFSFFFSHFDVEQIYGTSHQKIWRTCLLFKQAKIFRTTKWRMRNEKKNWNFTRWRNEAVLLLSLTFLITFFFHLSHSDSLSSFTLHYLALCCDAVVGLCIYFWRSFLLRLNIKFNTRTSKTTRDKILNQITFIELH